MTRFPRAVTICLLAAESALAQSTATLDSVMRVAERNGFSGVVRVEKDGKTLLERGYGMANRAAKIAFSPATVVQIGSNTKDFTAVAILQLQQAGILSLRDPLSKYFPAAPADKRDITIQQLLDHHAGFPLGIGGDFEVLSRDALIDRAMRTPLLFTPGARQSYSNTGFSLLAAILEQVTGKSYDVWIHDAVLAPLGLRRTGFHLPKFAPDDLAHGYLPAGTDAGTLLAKPHAADGPYWNLRGNGGMLSTVSDMHAFYKALFETETLMSSTTRALRFNPEEPIGLAGSDGVNFFLYDRFPRMRTELIIASTNAAMTAPAIRRELGKVLGLPNPDGDVNEDVAPRKGGKPAPATLATLVTNLVKTINAGDTTALRRFIAANFASGADEPTVDERLQRIGRLHEGLGNITVERMEVFDDGPLEVSITSTVQGKGMLRVHVNRAEPHRIRSLQVRIGG